MNKYLRNILLYVLIMVLALIISRTISNTLFSENEKYETIYNIYQTLVKLVVLLVIVYLIKQNKLFLFDNDKNYFNYIFVVLIFLYGIYSFYHTVKTSEIYNKEIETFKLISYTFFNISTGFFEEFFFRFLIFGMFCRYFYFKNKNVFKAAIFSSVLFSFFHLFNLLFDYMTFQDVLFQMLFAFGIGFFFQLIFTYTNNIFMVALFHGLINYNGMLSQKFFGVSSESIERTGFDYTTFIIIIILAIVLSSLSFIFLKNKKCNSFFKP